MSSDQARARLDAVFAAAAVVPVITIDEVDDAVPLAVRRRPFAFRPRPS